MRGSQEELHCVFVGKRKHMKDRMTREELWYCMRKSEVAKKYVRLLQDICEDNDGVRSVVVVTD